MQVIYIKITFFWQSSVFPTKEVTLPLLKLFYNCLTKKYLHVYVLAQGLKVWCFGHRYIIYCSNRAGEKPPNFGQALSF